MLTLLRSNDPVIIAYAVYSGACILAGLVAATMHIVPSLRPWLYTAPGAIVFVLGVLGSGKLVLFALFLPLELHDWSPTVANAVAIVVVAAIVMGVVIGLTAWLRARLRGQQPIRRVATDIAYWGGLFGTLFVLDLIEKRYQLPAFLIAIAVALPVGFAAVWWSDRRRRVAHEVHHS